ncbi:FtsB family cell division protein [Rhizobium sp. C4]|uniref:FtsB family cell division protein n=1 Tax=Rhizobium sp. C4 TaxID=1349800 RepID=UPI001E5A8EF2|nr:septum formation initiator family protein [Rhizobium sp. C4]MCD2171548.1 septum formation initiator family protein [Rhizobium sp. C4]
MLTKQYRKRRFGRFVLPAITAAFLAYFGYHSVHGEFGLKATEKFLQQKAERQQKLATLQVKRKALERQVSALSDGSIQKDMLDEEARAQLNMSRPDEIVIFH